MSRASVSTCKGWRCSYRGTHGGLVVGLERIFALANGGFVSRRYQVQGITLYANNGTALWPGLTLRLGKPSELTRIALKRRRIEGSTHGECGCSGRSNVG